MKILVLGAGKMGTFLTDVLCIQHEVALFDMSLPGFGRFPDTAFGKIYISPPGETVFFVPDAFAMTD